MSSLTLRKNFGKKFDKGGTLREIGESDLLGDVYRIKYKRSKGIAIAFINGRDFVTIGSARKIKEG